MNSPEFQRKVFIALLIAVSIAFFAILWPFFSAIFWAIALAILFAPLHRWITKKLPERPNLAALATLFVCLLIVILPLMLIISSLVNEGAAIVSRVRSGEINFATYIQKVFELLPVSVVEMLHRFGIGNLSELQAKLSTFATEVSQFAATQALNIGQNTFQFIISFGVMIYLLFFFLRDRRQLINDIRDAIPLSRDQKQELFSKFATVIKATVKGNIAVAAVQGALGGVIFWFLGIQGVVLWSVLMAFLSLLPAVGAGLIWGPVAAYFFATGNVWQACALIAWGVLVIGMVDNILRPILVGKDTKLPDYVVLISTIGGMSLFGLNGFVLGPMIAALFIAGWGLFSEQKAITVDRPATPTPATEQPLLTQPLDKDKASKNPS